MVTAHCLSVNGCGGALEVSLPVGTSDQLSGNLGGNSTPAGNWPNLSLSGKVQSFSVMCRCLDHIPA